MNRVLLLLAMLATIGVSVLAAQQVEIVPGSFNYKVTETNDSWWRVAWKVDVRNHGTSSASLVLRVKWKDAEGFELGTDIGTCEVSASSTETCIGSDLVDVQVAPKIAKASIGGGVR